MQKKAVKLSKTQLARYRNSIRHPWFTYCLSRDASDHPLNGSHLKSYVTYTLYPSPSHPPSHKHPPRILSVLQACVGRSDSFSLSIKINL